MTPVLPAVGPWFGVRALSPSSSSIRSTPMRELLADHLPHGDAVAGAEIDLAGADDDGAVGTDGEERVDCVEGQGAGRAAGRRLGPRRASGAKQKPTTSAPCSSRARRVKDVPAQ